MTFYRKYKAALLITLGALLFSLIFGYLLLDNMPDIMGRHGQLYWVLTVVVFALAHIILVLAPLHPQVKRRLEQSMRKRSTEAA